MASAFGGTWQVNGALNDKQLSKNGSSISQVEDFCKALGGDRPITSILIANNGMAAVKFMRSIRSWAYETFGTERAVLLVAMATPEDMRINAEHIRIADQFVEVPGGTNNNNYANVQLISEVCDALFHTLLLH
jgi:acetyl-CoA carboxylase/biotin carboxylase 1